MVAAPELITSPAAPDLAAHGINPGDRVRRNVGVAALVTEAVRAGDGVLADGGAVVVDTGKKTGRSADDKYIVREPGSEERIWWTKGNKALEPDSYERLRAKVAGHLG